MSSNNLRKQPKNFEVRNQISKCSLETVRIQVLDRDNLNRAFKKVKANKGAPGIDKMTIKEALEWIKEHRTELIESIRNGTYKPQPVRRKEIPKDNGKVRKLGIPTVIDRVIQQAIAQVLTPIFEPVFADGSYGYRPRRSAQQAIQKVAAYANEGYKWVASIDLSRYFDTLNHDLLLTWLICIEDTTLLYKFIQIPET